MFRDDRTLTPELFASTPRDWVSRDSDAWLYIDLFEELDLREFSTDYSKQGEEAVHPELMLRTIFYGLTHGVVSGRKLEEACHFDNRYIVLSGNQRPSYRTFYRFLIRHEERLNHLFVQVVRLAQQMGLASLGKVAIDGSRFKASTSRSKAMSYKRMQEAVEQLNEELKKLKEDLAVENGREKTSHSLPEEIQRREKRLAKIQAAKAALEKEAGGEAVDPKAQKSFADHDALPMAKPKDGFMYGYNCQAAVDADHQIIVAAEIHDNAADTGALISTVDKVEENCGSLPDQLLADAGYRSTENLEKINDRELDAYIATGKGEFNPERSYLEALTFNVERDSYECPAGKQIPAERKRKDGSRVLDFRNNFCSGCSQIDTCPLKSKQNKTMRVPEEKQRNLLVVHQTKMRSETGRRIYRLRKVIVEPVFGNLKNKGMRITVRGTKRVQRWWKMACTAHNIEKIISSTLSNGSCGRFLVIVPAS